MKTAQTNTPAEPGATPPPRSTGRWFRITARIIGAVFLLILLAGILTYSLTPAAIRRPAYQHYHLRLQVLVGGRALNFSQAKFQEGYAKDNCNAELTSHPFHFHDNRDQLLHVHWDNMTGGLLLKYYGWNILGGVGGTLGYRFDELPKIQGVPIHGRVLPSLHKNDKLYVFTGDEQGFKERPAEDFLKQDFETFFDKKSLLGDEGEQQANLLDRLFPKASAHGGTHAENEPHTEAELEAVNNLLGNVVIFAQKERPADDQIKARFDKLVPLDASTCGG